MNWNKISENLSRTANQIKQRYKRITKEEEQNDNQITKPKEVITSKISKKESENNSKRKLIGSLENENRSKRTKKQISIFSEQDHETQQNFISSENEKSTNFNLENSIEDIIAPWKDELTQANEMVHNLQKQVESFKFELNEKEKIIKQNEDIVKQKEAFYAQMKEKMIEEMKKILIQSELSDRAFLREKSLHNTIRLGYVTYGRSGEEYREGSAHNEIKLKEKSVEEKREILEQNRKKLQKRKTVVFNNNNNSEELEEILMHEHHIKLKISNLKIEENEILRQKELVRSASTLHWKELKRLQEEDGSKFNQFPILVDRYLMLQLLGRGGFSEVYRAYDLYEFRQVACKIHQLSSEWSTDKKSNYMRHAQRECEIHKALCHPRVVSLYEIFEIDKSSFCTILQYCNGGDLDSYLKQNQALPEIEARVLISQIFEGLKYLATRDQKIIHYDLKPGNILFDENGNVKIADFGLSKIMEHDSDAMELTSQGAGTYWYLPPECFNRDNPQISSKVDVWSAGVILYQMLFGCKPFGNNISQRTILEQNLINNTLQVDFPSNKKVSDEAKNFLKKCLTPNVIQRPDVFQLSQDPFLSFSNIQKKNSNKTNSNMLPPTANITSSGLITSSGTISRKI